MMPAAYARKIEIKIYIQHPLNILSNNTEKLKKLLE